jgi:hypothetical protein
MKTMIGYRNSTVGAAFLSTLIVASLLLFFPMKAHSAACGTEVLDLTAGQTINVGSVTVSNDANNIYVKYEINTTNQPSATFGTLHLWIGDDLANVDGGGASRPSPGKLPFISDGTVRAGYSFSSSAGSTSYTFTIPFSAINMMDISSSTVCASLPTLYVVAHAEVNNVDGGGGSLTSQTAFGGPTPGAGKAWWFYGQYTICCDFGGGGVCFTGTAFAKGGWVWTTDPKANPEKLSTLKLTKNRWGWAINLTGSTHSTYDIWAGAGLNDTSKGKKVGTMTVDWDGNGTSAAVMYSMFSGNFLEEVHIYASDFKPASMAQLAPGSFGNPTSGYSMDPNIASFSYTTSTLSDSNGDGVWLIGHALVSSSICD